MKKLLAITATALAPIAASAAPIIIDDFDSSDPFLFLPEPSRLVPVERSAGAVVDGSGVLEFFNGSPDPAGIGVSYEGPGPIDNFDATQGGIGTGFALVVESLDAGVTIEFEAADPNGVSNSLSRTFDAAVQDAVVEFAFADFDLDQFDGTDRTDFGSLASLQFSVSGPEGTGATIDALAIAVIPVPAAAPLMLAGLGGLVLLRRRGA